MVLFSLGVYYPPPPFLRDLNGGGGPVSLFLVVFCVIILRGAPTSLPSSPIPHTRFVWFCCMLHVDLDDYVPRMDFFFWPFLWFVCRLNHVRRLCPPSPSLPYISPGFRPLCPAHFSPLPLFWPIIFIIPIPIYRV